MTLLEILVKELPNRGGWPERAVTAYQSPRDGEVYFYTIYNGLWTQCDKTWYFQESDTRGLTNIITREQYEAELAASQQSVWDGEGLPPVGCECELFDCEAWNPVIIKYIGDKYVTTHRPDLNSEVVYCVAQRPEKFRPIRTKAEIDRSDSVDAFCDVLVVSRDCGARENLYKIYDAIATGKIPGIRLTDE